MNNNDKRGVDMDNAREDLSGYSIGGLYDLEVSHALAIARFVVDGEPVPTRTVDLFKEVQAALKARRQSIDPLVHYGTDE